MVRRENHHVRAKSYRIVTIAQKRVFFLINIHVVEILKILISVKKSSELFSCSFKVVPHSEYRFTFKITNNKICI